jgi:hypothetical protein
VVGYAQLLPSFFESENQTASCLTTIKDIVSILQSLFTIGAIILGGWLFVVRRKRYPRLKISHAICDKRISDDRTLIRVEVNIHNSGEVLARIKDVDVWVQQVVPCAELFEELRGKDFAHEDNESEYGWKVLCEKKLADVSERQIEPGEEDDLYFDFIVTNEVKSILVNTHIKNLAEKTKNIGWNKSTVYDLTKLEKEE